MRKTTIVLCLVFLIVTGLYIHKNQKTENNKKEPMKEEKTTEVVFNPSVYNATVGDYINIRINPTSNYNYLKKSDIYEIRKKYAKNSLFALEDYTPSDRVFGSIVDFKPWYGLKYYNCAGSTKGTKNITLGDSEESRFVNNPDILLGISCFVYKTDSLDDPLCTDTSYWTIPSEASFDKQTKTIQIKYKMPHSQTCTINGLNARDFGYDYIYATSAENIHFNYPNNITKEILELKDYIHNGTSCKVEGGCNNGSPYLAQTDLNTPDKGIGKMDIKLWKKMPKNSRAKGDINYQIIIDAN